ncbi:hypothetical protein GUJ93_ZPchr0014g47211 [Zizania palustris]|uniref:Uncharacterized protein n=1 Tax=Zizania palustris TaxID=103762 RepID=A0A8J5VVB7_ZIZPA|nr:hypothetical protein GUJ93_ZPchr0014g47211 [Zizania palustris]
MDPNLHTLHDMDACVPAPINTLAAGEQRAGGGAVQARESELARGEKEEGRRRTRPIQETIQRGAAAEKEFFFFSCD